MAAFIYTVALHVIIIVVSFVLEELCVSVCLAWGHLCTQKYNVILHLSQVVVIAKFPFHCGL